MGHGTSFAFIKLYVDDHDRLVDFYRDVLGMNVVSHEVDGEGENEHEESLLSFGSEVGSGPGGDLIIVQEYHRPTPPPGEVATCFWVNDADAVVKAAVEHGGAIDIAMEEVSRFNTLCGSIRDPEGRRIELMQPMA